MQAKIYIKKIKELQNEAGYLEVDKHLPHH